MVDAFNNLLCSKLSRRNRPRPNYLFDRGDYDQFKSELMSFHWKICLASGLTVEKCSYIASMVFFSLNSNIGSFGYKY